MCIPDHAKLITDSRNKRVIIIGDIHGSSKPFQTLLSKLSYNADFDTLIHVGDIISKGKHGGSLDVLSYMASHNVTGVRGNHDQKVLEWRAWMEWIRGFEGGERWLVEVDEREGFEGGLRRSGKWNKKIPKGWKMFSDHYRIARDMTHKQYKYLLSLPLVLHVPSAHTYIVHAGLLPYDPRRDQNHRRQPLSHLPAPFGHLAGLKGVTHTTPKTTKTDVERIRFLQELGLLHDIPQNLDPWVKLNMRGVRKNNKVTSKSKKGTPWSEIWNAAMAKCGGFDMDVWEDEQDLKKKGKGGKSFPCRPSTVVYGHAAARGLDIKRWSIGTDTGCVSLFNFTFNQNKSTVLLTYS
jgi:predicted phosphodiesterase